VVNWQHCCECDFLHCAGMVDLVHNGTSPLKRSIQSFA
jgi:hypothetical protein